MGIKMSMPSIRQKPPEAESIINLINIAGILALIFGIIMIIIGALTIIFLVGIIPLIFGIVDIIIYVSCREIISLIEI